MAEDMLIGVGVRADFSSLKSEAKTAADALKQARTEWDAAFTELGKAAEQGSAQAIQALKQYETALNEAVDRDRMAKQAIANSERDLFQKRVQQQRDFQDWLAKGKAAAEAEAAATEHIVPPMAAASGALREMSGNFDHNVRAAERFLSTSLGLGPVLQAAFPVVGALAFGGVLFDMGEKLVKFGMDAAEIGAELGGSWLDGAVAEVSGLAKEIKQADEDLLTLAQDLDRAKHQKDVEDVQRVRLTTQVDTFTRLTAGLGPETPANRDKFTRARAEAQDAGQKAGDDLEATQLQRQIDALDAIKRLHSQNVELIGKEIEAAERKAAQDRQSRGELEGTNTVGQNVQVEKLRKDQEVEDKRYQSALKDQNNLIEKRDDLILKGQIAEQRGQDAAVRGPASKADQEALRAAEVELNQMRRAHAVSLAEEQAFWEQKLSRFRANTSEYATIVGKLAQIADQERKAEERGLKEGRKDAADEAIAAKKKELQEDEQIHDALTRSWEEDLKQMEQTALEATRSADARIAAEAKVAEARVSFQLATGAINEQQAAYLQAQIRAKAYGDQIKVLEEELRQLKSIEAQGGNTQVRQSQAQDKIVGLQGDQQSVIIQGATKSATAFEKPWLKAFTGITQGWMRVQDQILLGQISLAQGAVRMLQDFELSFIHAFENILIEEVKNSAKRSLVHKVANTEIVASDATSAAAGEAIHKEGALKSIFMDAKTAAAGAFKGVMTHIPPPANFILAPIAAAGAFAGVMALAAFEKGGIVGGPAGAAVPIVAHAGERVLNVAQTRNFETLVSNASQARNTTVNARVNQYFPNASAGSSARETRSAVQGLARRNKLAI